MPSSPYETVNSGRNEGYLGVLGLGWCEA